MIPNLKTTVCGKQVVITLILHAVFCVSKIIHPTLPIVDSILTAKIFHIARPSTVQSLLLLGYREFGIGSMEQGWIFIGTTDLN